MSQISTQNNDVAALKAATIPVDVNAPQVGNNVPPAPTALLPADAQVPTVLVDVRQRLNGILQQGIAQNPGYRLFRNAKINPFNLGGHMRITILSFLLLMLAIPAFAAFQGPTDGAPTGTVQEVLSATWDDTPLCLEGNILNKVATSNKKYSFRDNTGTMVVEIKDMVFAGQDVTPNNRVRICGKVDKEYTKTNEFEVKQLQILSR